MSGVQKVFPKESQDACSGLIIRQPFSYSGFSARNAMSSAAAADRGSSIVQEVHFCIFFADFHVCQINASILPRKFFRNILPGKYKLT
jgi:hypothetical protein